MSQEFRSGACKHLASPHNMSLSTVPFLGDDGWTGTICTTDVEKPGSPYIPKGSVEAPHPQAVIPETVMK
jgi:hypothetical protein